MDLTEPDGGSQRKKATTRVENRQQAEYVFQMGTIVINSFQILYNINITGVPGTMGTY